MGQCHCIDRAATGNALIKEYLIFNFSAGIFAGVSEILNSIGKGS